MVDGRVIIAIDSDFHNPGATGCGMANLLEALGSAAKTVYCATASPIAIGLGILGNVYKGLGGDEQGDDLRAAGQLYRNGQQAACSRQPDDVTTEIGPLFSGGQCPGTNYTVAVSGSVTSQSGTQNLSGNTFGPGPVDVFVRTGPNEGTNNQVNVVATFGDGSDFVFFGRNTNDPNDTPSASIDNVVVNRVDGLPDDCGDPPFQAPEYDPGPWTSTPTITYDDDGQNTVTINPTFTFGPGELGPGGELTHPLEIEFENGITANFNFNVETGDISLFGGPGGSGDDLTDPAEDREEQPEDPQERDIVGVRVIVTAVGQGQTNNTIEQDNGNPNILIPNVGFVAFRYPTSSVGDGWGTDIPVKNDNFVAWADRPAIEVRGTPQDGWEFQVIPIRENRESCCN